MYDLVLNLNNATFFKANLYSPFLNDPIANKGTLIKASFVGNPNDYSTINGISGFVRADVIAYLIVDQNSNPITDNEGNNIVTTNIRKIFVCNSALPNVDVNDAKLLEGDFTYGELVNAKVDGNTEHHPTIDIFSTAPVKEAKITDTIITRGQMNGFKLKNYWNGTDDYLGFENSNGELIAI